jgi:fermentation-respiration switch protein FrsA (DUF1100 family)
MSSCVTFHGLPRRVVRVRCATCSCAAACYTFRVHGKDGETRHVPARTNLCRAAVPISGIYDLLGTYGHIDIQSENFQVAWSESGQARMGRIPGRTRGRYLENSPYHNADRINTPVLIVHGTKDDAYFDAGKFLRALRRPPP